MEPLFLFGTLQHRPLLEAVIGSCNHLVISAARLSGYEICSVAEGPFPTILKNPDGWADGLLVQGLNPADVERLDYYESAFEYRLQPVALDGDRRAQAYFPPQNHWTPAGPWQLGLWERDWAPLSVLAAAEVMSYFGDKTPAQIATMFPMIRARAWSQLNASHSRHGALTLKGRVDVESVRRPYANYFALDEYDLGFERFDADMTPIVTRAVFRAPDATLVLPYDPHRDCVLVVEQMRVGPLARGDRICWQLEPVAGRLDAGETPEDAARREAREEAGLEMGELLTVAETYCSPGNSSEFYYIFVGIADLPEQAGRLGGLDEEVEDIRSHILSFDRLMTLCDGQQVANTPLVLAAYWLARHRGSLRDAVGVR